MKLLVAGVALIALVGLAVATNPTMDDFGNYVRQAAIQEGRKEMKDPFGQLFSSVVGQLAGSLITSQTIRTDYLVLSTYEVQLGKQRLKALGAFRNFILLENPGIR